MLFLEEEERDSVQKKRRKSEFTSEIYSKKKTNVNKVLKIPERNQKYSNKKNSNILHQKGPWKLCNNLKNHTEQKIFWKDRERKKKRI